MKNMKVKIPLEGYVVVDLEVEDGMDYDDILELAEEKAEDYTELYPIIEKAKIIE